MAVNKVIKTINLNRFTLSCHELARPAFIASKKLRYQFQQKRLCRKFVEEAQSLEPLHAMQSTNKSFHFFAGWHWLELCQSAGVDQVLTITYKDIHSHQIHNLAWHYLLSKHAADLHRKSNLAQLSNLIEQIPLDIRKSQFDEHHSYSTLTTTTNLTGETRAAIRHQLEKNNEPTPIPPETSLLSELLGEN